LNLYESTKTINTYYNQAYDSQSINYSKKKIHQIQANYSRKEVNYEITYEIPGLSHKKKVFKGL
jgi:hypothetical protein